MKRLLTLLVILAFFLNLRGSYAANVTSIELSDLPSIVITYNIFCSRYDEFQLLESKPESILIKLANNIDKLTLDIPTRMAFTHMAFIVQNNIEGQIAGFTRVKKKTLEESKIPFKSIVFVSTPIESFGNRTIVILSSISPERTTIFTIDNKLNVELLYDSFKKNEIKNINNIKGTTTIGSIYGIQVQKPGYFLLEERMEVGGSGFVSPYENRTFIVNLSKGEFELLMKAERK